MLRPPKQKNGASATYIPRLSHSENKECGTMPPNYWNRCWSWNRRMLICIWHWRDWKVGGEIGKKVHHLRHTHPLLTPAHPLPIPPNSHHPWHFQPLHRRHQAIYPGISHSMFGGGASDALSGATSLSQELRNHNHRINHHSRNNNEKVPLAQPCMSYDDPWYLRHTGLNSNKQW